MIAKTHFVAYTDLVIKNLVTLKFYAITVNYKICRQNGNLISILSVLLPFCPWRVMVLFHQIHIHYLNTIQLRLIHALLSKWTLDLPCKL